MKLQPIESAPKDGSYILLFTTHKGKAHKAFNAFWYMGDWFYDGAYEDEFSHWCPLPTLEDDSELQAVKAERDSLLQIITDQSKKLGQTRKYLREANKGAERLAIAFERDQLRKFSGIKMSGCGAYLARRREHAETLPTTEETPVDGRDP